MEAGVEEAGLRSGGLAKAAGESLGASQYASVQSARLCCAKRAPGLLLPAAAAAAAAWTVSAVSITAWRGDSLEPANATARTPAGS